MIVSEFSPNSVVVANRLLVAVPLEFIIVKEDKDRVIPFVPSWGIWFDPLDVSVSGC